MELRNALTFIMILISFSMNAQVNKDAEVMVLQLHEKGNFPNNPVLPVLVYKNVFDFKDSKPEQIVEQVFAQNNWGGTWRNGIYSFQHYHSTAHEALAVIDGWAEVQLGGPGEKAVRIEKGDLVILPAGTAHKKVESGENFSVIGAYPDKQSWDMNYGKADEFERAKSNIQLVRLPQNDPVFGRKGKMFLYWD
jgi:uncharacterized protein YjlB